jgi:hypothetical protein
MSQMIKRFDFGLGFAACFQMNKSTSLRGMTSLWEPSLKLSVTLDKIRCSSARRVRKPRLAFQQT